MRSDAPQGLGQLTLVEHALCPLESATSLRPNLVHNTEYSFSDRHRKRMRSSVRVFCPLGLSAHDEFYLWGLLAVTLGQQEPMGHLLATPHYCLRQLGLIDQHQRRGGRQYRQFVEAIERLAAVRYQNSHFYDPIRAEHRRVTFGFFSYSLPLDPNSNRAWRIMWDPLFFEFVRTVGGAARFDLSLYRELDPASRRLFLFVSKVFSRRETTPRLDLRQLGEQVLGFAPSLKTWDLRVKFRRCLATLAERDVLAVGSGLTFKKSPQGRDEVILRRGRYFDQRRKSIRSTIESPLVGPIRELGVDDQAVARLLKQLPQSLLGEWLDITLSARERFGPAFFKRSPAAYFVDNVTHAHAGQRTPPDWWHEVRKAEEQAQAERDRRKPVADSAAKSQASEADNFTRIRDEIFGRLLASGQPATDAKQTADRYAQTQLQPASHPERRASAKVATVGAILHAVTTKSRG